MRPPRTRNGRPPQTPVSTAKTSHHHVADHGHSSNGTARMVAFGEFYPPAGRRTLGVVIVRRCPGCGHHLHLHRASSAAAADGSTRVGSCGTEYRLRVLPAQRIGGAA